MAKKKKPGTPASPESRFLTAFSPFLDAEGPVMITAWVSVIEYLDADGQPRLAAFASETPDWRIQGMLTSGGELLANSLFYDDWED
jgi:hypothetical protein